VTAHRHQDEFGSGVLSNRAQRSHGERLVERLGVHVVGPADLHPDPGHRAVTGPPLDGVDDRAAEPELVHYGTTSRSATISTLTATSG
jgi:hypothetical protein